ncbi:transcriptional regulator, AraC family [Stanieria cyanosphaera PCC 7437]|uniref:Transcriptional regulator, AraC family n=1 Tax=Stanieria cyanosphaera (strain ATCC 29371 / PCC 7437) TaxID=111780 RepID=K9XWW9_STAC7|nr:AraC family transcriptional regulator [Stanieria cyanosphaera]AFZ36576.1 transcriptional regulator, AraC family [Stanieria cyanosphaera PCC 7437]
MGQREKLLAINYQKKEELLQILSDPPLLTSQQLRWNGLEVQSHQQPPGEIPEHISDKHIIAIHHPQKLLFCERFLEDQKKIEQIENGQIAIVPANVSHQSRWHDVISATVIVIEPQLIAHIAYESVNSEKVQLLPTFAIHDPIIHQIGSLLKLEIEAVTQSQLYIDGLKTALSAHLLRQHCTIQQAIRDYEVGLPSNRLKKAIEYINENLSEDIGLVDIADKLGMSQYYFCRLFKKSTGITPHAYMIQQRIEKAKQLLKQSKLTINEIAIECGFANPSHFARHFRKHTDLSPKQFRIL